MKRFLCILIASFVLTAFCVNADSVKQTSVCDGIELIKTTKETDSGLQKISVLKIDLNNPFITLKTLYSTDGINRLERVKTLVDDHNAIAGINGDFFLWSNGGGSSVGYNVVDGEMITSPAVDENMASVAMDDAGNFIFDYFTAEMSIKTKDGHIEKIKNVNKYDDLSGVVLYNSAWGEYSLGSTGNLVEVVVQNNTIKEIRKDKSAAKIPENGYVLAGLSDLTDFFDKIKVGERLTLNIDITPEINVENAIGGGTLLVTKGESAPITHASPGRAPRSAFGIDKNADYAYLVTVDGRGASNSIGMTLDELTGYLLELGAYNAINFDGGGSSQLVAKIQGDDSASYLNTPSENRAVSNAYGVFHSGIENVLIDHDEEMHLFEDMPTTIGLYPEDTIGELINTDEQTKFGKTSTKLLYDFTIETDKLQSAGLDFENPLVIGSPDHKVKIDVYAEKENEQWLRYFLTDADGKLHRCTLADTVDWEGWKTLEFDLDNSIKYPAKLTRIYLVQPERDVRTKGAVYFDNITINKPYVFAENNLSVLSPFQYENTLFNRLAALEVINELDKSAYSVSMSDAYDDISGNIKRENFSKTVTKDINVLQITDATAPTINWLNSEIRKNKSSAIVIISNEDVYSKIKSFVISSKKPVFYIYNGTETYFETEKNVTKISLANSLPDLNGHNTVDMVNIYKTKTGFDFNIRRFKLY